MKRLLSFVLVFTMVLCLSACRGGAATDSSGDNTEENVIKHSGKMINGEITGASVFAEGLAFVYLNGNSEKAYCIDRQGNIVFELDNKTYSVGGEILTSFENGLAFVDGGFCDTNGKITYPEDVGASEFFDVAIKGGYIIATVITADYSSTKQEMGVMNTDFEWVVQPSESIYRELEENLWTTSALNTQSYFVDGMVYFEGCNKYLNVETGEVLDHIDSRIPSELWTVNSDYTFRDSNGEIMVDLSSLDNIERIADSYKEGKAPVIFRNRQAGKSFWGLVDENGELVFDPVELNITDLLYSKILFDGEHTVIYDDATEKLSSFNSNGELAGELNVEDFSWCSVGEGVIMLISGGTNSKKCEYYKMDFTPLF